MTRGTADLADGDRTLDVEVARKALGFRWARWNERTAPAKADEFGHGRFLAPPDHVAARHQVEADASGPLAPRWDRFLPAFSTRVEPAIEAAERVDLFRRAVTLRKGADDRWGLRAERGTGSPIVVEGETLPMVLCLGVLEAVSGEGGLHER